MMGYLYYGNYAKLYEIGRVEAIRYLGLDYRKMEEEDGIMLPVVALEARYGQPARYDELLTIQTVLHEIPGKMIVFENRIANEEGICIHTAVVKLFFVDKHSGMRVSCPQILLEKLKPYFHVENKP